MSFYRPFITAIATMGLATTVFAAVPAATPTAAPATTVATAVTQKVNLNKADAKDLAAVKGMTASKVKAIIAYRKKQGDFKSMDELKNVKGFKRMDEKTMKEITDQLTLG